MNLHIKRCLNRRIFPFLAFPSVSCPLTFEMWPEHFLGQMAFGRTRNDHEELKRLFYGCHPGVSSSGENQKLGQKLKSIWHFLIGREYLLYWEVDMRRRWFFSFSERKSNTILHRCCRSIFFETIQTGVLYGDFDSFIISWSNKSFTWRSIFSLCVGG